VSEGKSNCGEDEKQSDSEDEEEKYGNEELRRLSDAADSSPLVVLTMNSSSWLSEKFRDDFIDSSTSQLSLPSSKDAILYMDALHVSVVRDAKCM